MFTCLNNDAAIEETITAFLRVENIQRKTFVDYSLVHPDTINHIAEKLYLMKHLLSHLRSLALQLCLVLVGWGKEIVNRVKPYCKGIIVR